MKVSGLHHDAGGGVHLLPVPQGVSGVLLACASDVVGPAPDAVMAEFEVDTVVCLMESEEVDRRFPTYAAWLAAAGPDRAVQNLAGRTGRAVQKRQLCHGRPHLPRERPPGL